MPDLVNKKMNSQLHLNFRVTVNNILDPRNVSLKKNLLFIWNLNITECFVFYLATPLGGRAEGGEARSRQAGLLPTAICLAAVSFR